MTLMTIRLELARDHDFPEGSAHCGYEFVAPLGDDGHIDADEWRRYRDRCRVRRFWEGQDDEHGRLVRMADGTWAFHYDEEGLPEADEPGYRFESHAFKEGEYVSIRELDGTLRTFRVESVAPVIP